MAKYVMALDAGTTIITDVFILTKGETISSAQKSLLNIFRNPGLGGA